LYFPKTSSEKNSRREYSPEPTGGRKDMFRKIWPLFCLLFYLSLASKSLAYASDLLVIDRFDPADKGSLPTEWRARNDEETEKAQKIYKVSVEGANAYLSADSRGDAVQIGKKVEVDLMKYPSLEWCWKVTKLCKGGDERYKATGDSAAAVYVVFPTWKMWKPKALKYVWSASGLPKGYRTESPYSSDTKIIVLQNKHSPLDTWIQEKVNVLSDYEKYWGKKLEKVNLIGLMSDSDNTGSEAIAAYDDLEMTSDDSAESRH
jgi:hypothetical protein